MLLEILGFHDVTGMPVDEVLRMPLVRFLGWQQVSSYKRRGDLRQQMTLGLAVQGRVLEDRAFREICSGLEDPEEPMDPEMQESIDRMVRGLMSLPSA